MRILFKYLVLPALVVGVVMNLKDLQRYIRIRNM